MKAGDRMPSGIEVTKQALDDFKKIQEYMLIAREENAAKTYAKLKKDAKSIVACVRRQPRGYRRNKRIISTTKYQKKCKACCF